MRLLSSYCRDKLNFLNVQNLVSKQTAASELMAASIVVLRIYGVGRLLWKHMEEELDYSSIRTTDIIS